MRQHSVNERKVRSPVIADALAKTRSSRSVDHTVASTPSLAKRKRQRS